MKIVFKCTNASCGMDLSIDDTIINPANPKVRCSKCKKIIDLGPVLARKRLNNEKQAKKNTQETIAWLVVHDENTDKQVFNLKAGKYIVGRYNQSKPCDVMIKCNDHYMSRNHCVLEVRASGSGIAEVLLTDNKSTNGTWLNAKELVALKEGEIIFLEDDDMLQLGMTKVIVKLKQGKIQSQQDASSEVFRKKHGKTRIIDF